MPKRAIVAAAATALGLALLLSFKTPDDPDLAGTTGASGRAVAAPTAAAGQTQGPDGGQTSGGAVATPRPTTAPGAAATATPPPAGGALADGTIDGPVVTTRFGPVQVEITIAGGKVTSVSALELPSDHPRSAAISEYAEPILRTEVLQAQSAQIDLVSGATYTSIAYERSLQAALDQANG
jgi:uncharacterized protein with FMN-binding domain